MESQYNVHDMIRLSLSSHEPDSAVIGQLWSLQDELPNGRRRLATRLYLGGRWTIVPFCHVELNGVKISFNHYRDLVWNRTGKMPESDTAASIEAFISEYLVPGDGIVAHVADYNYAPFLFLVGADNGIVRVRTEDSESWGMIPDGDTWESINA